MKVELILAQMARSPSPGTVKTSLIPHLSPQQAADLHGALLLHTCSTLLQSSLGDVHLWVAGDENVPVFERCREMGVSTVLQQSGPDLGARMSEVCVQSLARANSVILVGSDAPGIDTRYLSDAVGKLRDVDAVIGPAEDGGYVLLGLKRHHLELFGGVDWGTSQVLAQTVQRLEDLKWSWDLLPSLPDIDRPEDLRFLPEALCTF